MNNMSIKDRDTLLGSSNAKEETPKFNVDKLQEIAKPAMPHKKPTPEDKEKYMEELHQYAEEKKIPKDIDEMIDDYFKSLFPNIAYYKWRTSDVYVHASPDGIRNLCDHFYELGKNSK